MLSSRSISTHYKRLVSSRGFAALSSRLTPAEVQLRSSMMRSDPITSEDRRHQAKAIDEARNDLAYCLSFANDDSDFERNFKRIFPTKQMQEQLQISKSQLRRVEQHVVHQDLPLPKTIEDALRPSRQARVVTEATAPFRIVDVNDAWENLCGYSYVEAKGKTLGELLQGPATDKANATALIYKVLQGEEAGTTLTNYKKNGDQFRNRLRAGPLYEGTSIKYFVGVLQEL